jgi:CheY-like chemotaxis protein
VAATSVDAPDSGGQRRDPGDEPVAVFSVTDTGIGIAPENLAVIFGAFQQGDGTLSRRYGGTGLGLSIASEVSALLGGTISATSDLGHGSTFTLSVPAVLPDMPPTFTVLENAFALPDGVGGLDDPLGHDALAGDRHRLGSASPDAIDHLHAVTSRATALAATAATDSATTEAGVHADAAGARAVGARGPALSGPQDRKVLVFEPTSGGLLTLLAHSAVSDLAQLSATVRVSTATTPGQGTAMLAAEPFRCVVVDLGMSTTLEFLDQVQEKPELREIPVLAHAPGELGTELRDRLAALRYGYPSLELLPSLDDLRERITLHLSAAQLGQVPALVRDVPEHVAHSAGAHHVTAPSHHPELRGKHVLVIDDDARNVFAISSTLELHDLRVTQASDGRRGIEALRAAPDTDLILMDVMMPGMDGYATMTAIRQMPQFGRLPIIAVTARAMPGDREKSLAAGANDYVTKPVDTEELLACMERWLSKG